MSYEYSALGAAPDPWTAIQSFLGGGQRLLTTDPTRNWLTRTAVYTYLLQLGLYPYEAEDLLTNPEEMIQAFQAMSQGTVDEATLKMRFGTQVGSAVSRVAQQIASAASIGSFGIGLMINGIVFSVMRSMDCIEGVTQGATGARGMPGTIKGRLGDKIAVLERHMHDGLDVARDGQPHATGEKSEKVRWVINWLKNQVDGASQADLLTLYGKIACMADAVSGAANPDELAGTYYASIAAMFDALWQLCGIYGFPAAARFLWHPCTYSGDRKGRIDTVGVDPMTGRRTTVVLGRIDCAACYDKMVAGGTLTDVEKWTILARGGVMTNGAGSIDSLTRALKTFSGLGYTGGKIRTSPTLWTWRTNVTVGQRRLATPLGPATRIGVVGSPTKFQLKTWHLVAGGAGLALLLALTTGVATKKRNPGVAQAIMDQIGRRAFFILGAKSFVFGDPWLSFRVGRNAKGVHAISVRLNPSGTYAVAFFRQRGRHAKLVAEYDDVYAENLHDVLEAGTGMATRL